MPQKIQEYFGLLAIQSIVLTALSGIIPGYMSAPSCMPGMDSTCSVLYSANLATGGDPVLTAVPDMPNAYVLRQPILDPNRMTLATYKIFGEVAAAMMAIGPTPWTSSNLTGLDPITDLVPGRVPWQFVLSLLFAWLLITAVPQCFTFTEKRWSSTLEAFEMFRFGAEWREAVQKFESNDFSMNSVLRQIPGLVGDVEPSQKTGFVGLSRAKARADRWYTNERVNTI